MGVDDTVQLGDPEADAVTTAGLADEEVVYEGFIEEATGGCVDDGLAEGIKLLVADHDTELVEDAVASWLADSVGVIT